MENNYKEFKGFSLFTDVEDEELRAHNRGQVMANIATANTRGTKINGLGSALVLGYFNMLSMDDRLPAMSSFESAMNERGFTTNG